MMKFVVAVLLFLSFSISLAKESPNVVIILADDLGIGDVACYSEGAKFQTPHLDAVAGNGMRFTQAYAPGAVCSPSRYGLLTGQYPCRGPLRDKNVGSATALTIDDELLTFPELFADQGYINACIGKWHLGYGEQGIKNWAGRIAPGPLELGFHYHLGLPTNHNDFFKTYVENHHLKWLKPEVTTLRGRPGREHLSAFRFDDEVDSDLTREAVRFIHSNRDRPFFLYLALVATHTHITPQADFRGESEIGLLGDYIQELDHHVGQVVAALKAVDQLDNTILVFSSDNGGHMKDHPSSGKDLVLRDESGEVAEKSKTAKADAFALHGHRTNLNLRGHKGTNYEGGFRVPLLVQWPGKVAKAAVSSEMITLTDLMATTAGLAQVSLPEDAAVDSFDLSRVLLGEHEGAAIRDTAILQTGANQLAFRQGDWKIRSKAKTRWEGDQANVVMSHLELYNLKSDPGESVNLADEQPDRVKQMRKLLLKQINSGRSRP